MIDTRLILNRNKQNILNARKTLDTLAAVSFGGIAEDKVARNLVVNGVLTILSAGLTGIVLSLTGTIGPVMMGVSLVRAATNATTLVGTAQIAAGLTKGFKFKLAQAQHG